MLCCTAWLTKGYIRIKSRVKHTDTGRRSTVSCCIVWRDIQANANTRQGSQRVGMLTDDSTNNNMKITQNTFRQDYNTIDAATDEVQNKKAETKRNGLECTENEKM